MGWKLGYQLGLGFSGQHNIESIGLQHFHFQFTTFYFIIFHSRPAGLFDLGQHNGSRITESLEKPETAITLIEVEV